MHVGRFLNGGDAVVSSSGVAACRHGFGPDVGFGYGWGTERAAHLRELVQRRRVGGRPRRPARSGLRRSAASAIAGGQPAAVFSVVGSLAPPRAILTGPDGATVAATPDDPAGGIDDGKVLLFQNPEDRTTYIARQGPGGRAVPHVAEAGLRPRELFRSAQSLPAPLVRARVDGTGRRRALRWIFTAVRGRSVVFYEQGRDTRRRLDGDDAPPRPHLASPCPTAGRDAARSSPSSARTG